MIEQLRQAMHATNGHGRMRLPPKKLDLPTHKLARRLAEQAADGRPVCFLDESDYVPVLEERNDVPILVAHPQNAWQLKPPPPLTQWPAFLSVFSSFGIEVLHRHAAVNRAQVADQVEIYLLLAGVARVLVPHGHGKVAVQRLLPHSIAVVYPNAYHYISWEEPGYGLVFRAPNYSPDVPNGKVIWADSDGH